jgi:hypothetical protein
VYLVGAARPSTAGCGSTRVLFAGVFIDGVVALAEHDRQARRHRMLLLDDSSLHLVPTRAVSSLGSSGPPL